MTDNVAMEVWLHSFAVPGRVADLARRAETWGFTGLLLADSQNLTADIWVELALAGNATSTLRLAPGVTNPVTRHVAVTASAAATLQVETGGRATVGFARGDSALTQIGHRPVTVAEFEHSLELLQGLLRGETVRLGDADSTIRWLHETGCAKVPVHVSASGPRVIAAGARHAEGVDLTVGAELDRVAWGASLVRETGGAGVSVGAYVNVAVDPDRDRARRLIRGSTATFARFSAEANAAGRLSATTAVGVRQASGGYEAAAHGRSTAGSAQDLDPGFVDRFAIAGPAAEVGERLAAIAAAARLDRVIIVPGSLDAGHEAVLESIRRFADQVLPSLSEPT